MQPRLMIHASCAALGTTISPAVRPEGKNTLSGLVIATCRPAASMISSFGGGIRRTLSDEDGAPREHAAAIHASPEPDQRNQSEDRNDDVANDATDRVEGSMEHRHEQVGSNDSPADTQATPSGGSEDRAAEDRRPHPMAERRQHT